jgi:GTPase
MDELNNNTKNISFDNLEQEKDDGNIEYKRELLNLDEDKINKRSTQMKYRIIEGSGEAFYFIGVRDNGKICGLNIDEYTESVNNLKLIANKIDCNVIKISEVCSNKKTEDEKKNLLFSSEVCSNKNNNNLYIGEYLIRENTNNYIEIRVGVAGNVDSGKSTTIGTLTHDVLDDGNGKSRLSVFNFKHEVISGRTSSISHQILGYDVNGNVINSSKNNSVQDITKKSSKIISFYDLCGHQKYLKITVYGLTSMFLDYCLIIIGANMGISHMTREHIGLCISLKIPFIILVTKIDIVPPNILEETMQKINNMCRNKIRKIPYIIKNISDIITVSKNIKTSSIIPILQISNVTSYNLNLLKSVLNLLPLRNDYSKYVNSSLELLIDTTYSVYGHSTIVSGMIKSGNLKVNDNLLIGPFYDSSYKSVKVRSIHLNYIDIKEAKAGSFICVSLKGITRKEIRKGMLLIADNNNKLAIKSFIANIHILHSPTTIKVGYQPFVHIEHVRQTVKLMEIRKNDNLNNLDNPDNPDNPDNSDNLILRSGDKATVKLTFIIKPEYIKVGMRLIFRESQVKAVGNIIEIL